MADENGELTFLPIQEGTVGEGLLTSGAELGEEPLKELSGNHEMENGVSGDIDMNHDKIFQCFLELSLQNAYLVGQLNEFKAQVDGTFQSHNQEKEDSHQLMLFQQKIEILTKEILELKETQKPAEDALKYIRIEYSEADAKVHDLSIKLVEAQQKMEEEIKARDEKYAELDSKFGRLHKRAKQRIQEIQKEKDDLEARFRDVTEKAEQASSQQSSMQQELERARLQASEALRSMDMERQQLRTTNNKLRDDIDEMHRAVEIKQNTLEELRKTIFKTKGELLRNSKKGRREEARLLGRRIKKYGFKMLEETRHLLQAAEDRKQTSIIELSTKHKKIVDDLEVQIAEAITDRSKAAETALSLQTLIGEKDAKIAELEAASTGEAVRLGAAVEATKAEIAHLKNEHEKEKEIWETALQALKVKLEASESTHLHSEIEAAKIRSELELKLSLLTQLLTTKDFELKASKEEIARLESDFSSYKVRAHALLQKKDAELRAAKENEVSKAQENAIREAEREVALSLAERDKAFQDLQNALDSHGKEIAARDAVLSDAVQQARYIARELDSVKAQYQSEKESWQKSVEDLEDNWRMKCHALEIENNERSQINLKSEVEDLMLQHIQLKEEHETFRGIVDRMLEEKDKEISKLLEDNNALRQSLESNHVVQVNYNGNLNTEFVNQDAPNYDVAAAEQQILLLARQQAQREEELAQSQRHILALQDEIEELERENRLHSQQEALLKEEVRNVERKHKREGVDMTYLKNVILKLLETGEVEALLPVVGTLLQFSPDEIRKCQQAYRSSTDMSLSSTTSSADAAASTPLSLFSKFSFS